MEIIEMLFEMKHVLVFVVVYLFHFQLIVIKGVSDSDILSQKQDRHYWYELSRKSLERKLSKDLFSLKRPIRNVVMFIGDGMGVSTLTAARILKGQREGRTGEDDQLIWDLFPAVALTKTYNLDAQIGESSACATALMCGVKANYETLGVDSSVRYGECVNTSYGSVPSLFSWAHQYGKHTGIVTTTRITHATPAALYAHSPSRFWEDDSKVDVKVRAICKDIAKQLVEDDPGASIKVILGGGRRHFTSISTLDPDPHHKEGKRLDGRNLIEEWIRNKQKKKYNATYVHNSRQLNAVDVSKTDYLLGLFSHSHMDFDSERDKTPNGQPSLSDMTLKALQILQSSENGYFLVVEGGRIDHGHHFNNAYRALDETLCLESAVTKCLELVNLTDTLVVVTADHSHVMVLGGYATPKGNSIFGYDKTSDANNRPYSTLLYSNGPGGIENNNMKKRESSPASAKYINTIQKAAVPRSWATHAGEDVPLYAIGSLASDLFSGTIDQTYIPHAIAYGSCIGPYKNHFKIEDLLKTNKNKSNSAKSNVRTLNNHSNVLPVTFQYIKHRITSGVIQIHINKQIIFCIMIYLYFNKLSQSCI